MEQGSIFMKKEAEGMTEKEQLGTLIDSYTNLQRIKAADNRDKEIAYQLAAVRAKLEAYGIMVENLDLN